MKFDVRERCAVLTGLCLLRGTKTLAPALNTLYTHGDQINPLTDDEIEALGVRIRDSAKSAPAMSPSAQRVLANVEAAMQDAEEIWGCEDTDDYVRLMHAIQSAAQLRIDNATKENNDA